MEVSIQDGPSRTTMGRWVGGLVGVAACLAVSVVAGMVAGFHERRRSGQRLRRFDPNGLAWIAIGGLPIAFIGGQALLPAARSGGWLAALAVGFVFGLVAPPLGAIEVVFASMLPFSGSTSGFGDNVGGLLFVLPIAVVYSYVVVVLTVPAGLLWALVVRAIPERRTA